MKDYTASSLDDQAQGLADFIESEALSASRTIRNNLILLAVVSAILVGYFVALNTWVDEKTEPVFLATEGYKLVDQNIPDLAAEMEKVMNDVTPQVADFIANKAVGEGVPFLIGRSEQFLETYVDQMTSQTSDLITMAFTDVVEQNKEGLRDSLFNPQSGDDPSKALKPLRDKLHASFNDSTTGKRSEAGLSVDHSLTALKNLNRRLKTLASADPSKMDRKDKMGARLLRSYWGYMRATSPDEAGEDMPVSVPGSDAP
jgi:hypothetical protein